jgi:uncharacterized DUF497 family protein
VPEASNKREDKNRLTAILFVSTIIHVDIAYSELRMCAIAYIGNRLHYVVYVDRDSARRVISLRKANLREMKRYAEA